MSTDLDLSTPCTPHVGPTTNSGYGTRWQKYEDGTVETLVHRQAWRAVRGPILEKEAASNG